MNFFMLFSSHYFNFKHIKRYTKLKAFNLLVIYRTISFFFLVKYHFEGMKSIKLKIFFFSLL